MAGDARPGRSATVPNLWFPRRVVSEQHRCPERTNGMRRMNPSLTLVSTDLRIRPLLEQSGPFGSIPPSGATRSKPALIELNRIERPGHRERAILVGVILPLPP